MNFALADVPLPMRLRPATAMSDDELMQFCAANDFYASNAMPMERFS